MSITKEKAIKNAKKYFDTAKAKGDFITEELINFLGEDFIGAPASTTTDLNNAFEGGLIDHLLRVTKYAILLNKNVLPTADKNENFHTLDENSLFKVCLLHGIGKAKLYQVKDSAWHNERGIMYDFNNDLKSMSVGERSVFYATSNGVSLTEDEYQAILNHDKSDSKQAEWHSESLGNILKMAIKLAIMEEKASV
jgi:hypothetical protein